MIPYNYFRSEAERLPNDAAAKFRRMLHEQDSLLTQETGHLRQQTPDPDNAVTTDDSVITITISRNCAEYFAERACTNDRACFTEVGGCVALDCHLEQACLAALEAKRGDCWCRGCQNDEHCRVALGGAAKAEVEPHPVCVVHLAWIPCRHGHPNSPCEWRCDEASQTAVGRFHTGELSRSEALDIFKALEGS